MPAGAFPSSDPNVVQARFRAGDGFLDTKQLTFGMAEASGAEVVLRCRATGFETTSDGSTLTAVVTDRGTISCPMAVIAGGPLSGLVAGAVGLTLPIVTIRRHKLILPDLPAVPPGAPMTIDEDTGAHWRPAFAGAWALFTDPTTPPEPPTDAVATDPGFAFRLLDPAQPASLARVVPFWRDVWDRGDAHWLLQAGQYTVTPDHRPLIGPAGPARPLRQHRLQRTRDHARPRGKRAPRRPAVRRPPRAGQRVRGRPDLRSARPADAVTAPGLLPVARVSPC